MPRRARPEWDKVAASRIAKERARRAWSQQRLADALGVDRKTIGRWESGDTSPEAAQLQGLALAGWDVHYILTGERSGTSAAVSYLSRDEEWLLKKWRAMNERQREGWRLLLNECNAVKEPAGTIHDGAADPYRPPTEPQD